MYIRILYLLLVVGCELQIGSDQFVSILTTSAGPSCYMYTFANVTSRRLRHSTEMLDAALERHRDANNVTGLSVCLSAADLSLYIGTSGFS